MQRTYVATCPRGHFGQHRVTGTLGRFDHVSCKECGAQWRVVNDELLTEFGDDFEEFDIEEVE